MKNILILGGSGLLGTNLACYLRKDNNIILGLHKKAIKLPGVQILYIEDLEANFSETLKKNAIHIVINTVGLTSVENCQTDPEKSYNTNVKFVETLTEKCSNLGVDLIHISTDHLFNSNKKTLHQEESETNPVNIYGRHKLQSESPVLSYDNGCVLRTNFFGIGSTYRKSFSDYILENLNGNKRIFLFEDVYYTPVSIRTISSVVVKIISENIRGLINVSCNELITKVEFGTMLAEKFNLDTSLITSVKISSKKHLVERPTQMGLDNYKLRELFPSQDFSICKILDEYYTDYNSREFNDIKNLI